jgi:hypothetical protein
MDMYVIIESLFARMKRYTERLRSTHQYKDIINIYRGFLKPSHYERKNGGVPTPFEPIENLFAEYPPPVVVITKRLSVSLQLVCIIETKLGIAGIVFFK